MKKLKLAQLNVRSLSAHLQSVREIVHRHEIDIIGLTETWLSSNISNASLAIDNYSIIRKDYAARGSGVCIYVRRGIKFRVEQTSREIEQLCISATVNTFKIAVCIFYRNHDCTHRKFIDELELTVGNCQLFTENLVLMGDMNIDLFKTQDIKTVDYINSLDNMGVVQLINQPTRECALLDHVIVSNIDNVADYGVEVFDASDHDLTYCILKVKKPKASPSYLKIRNYKNFSIEDFLSDLREAALESLYRIDDIDDKVYLFNSTILALFDRHAPMRTIRVSKPYSPWLTDNIRLMMAIRDQAKRAYTRTRTESDFAYYKSMRNLVTLSIKNEKKAYYATKFNTKNSKLLYREFKRLNITSKKTKEIPEELCDVERINNYFVDTVPGDNGISVQETVDYYTDGESSFGGAFQFTLIDDDIIIRIITELRSNATGSDHINLYMLKICGIEIVKFITHIINSCLLMSYFPKSWKVANVVPYPKTDNPADFSELRAVSILPVLSKILEKVMLMQLRDHLNEYSILPEEQAGFRKGYDCTTALLNVTDDILRATDCGKLTILVLLDFSRAFDSIRHEVMIAILKYIGLGTDALALMSSYLRERFQRVVHGNAFSSLRAVNTGVPQGSILGPTLFSIYTSLLPTVLNSSSVQMYADDTQIYLSFPPTQIHTVGNNLNHDLRMISEYASRHSLFLNPRKCCAIVFGPKKFCDEVEKIIKLTINSSEVPFVKSVKNLGIMMDNSFRYRDYINVCLGRAYGSLKMMYPHRSFLPVNIKKSLCSVLVLSQLNYASVVYSPALDSESMYKVQKLQNSCVRFIYGLRKFDHVSHKLTELGWLNMKHRFLFRSACLYNSVISTGAPYCLYRKITFRTDVHNVNIRRKDSITPPQHRLALFERSFSYNIYVTYNDFLYSVTSSNMSRGHFRRSCYGILWKRQTLS